MSETTDARRYDVLTFGDLCVDLILQGGDIRPRFGQVEQIVGGYALELGGSCSIFACQAARLGLRVALLGRVGDDIFGRFVLEQLAACGVDTRYVIVDPTLRTGLGVALCEADDRAILTYPGSLAAVQPDDITDELLASASHLHHGSFFLHTLLRPHIPAIFARAHALGLTISLDTNWDPEETWSGSLMDALPLVDIFMPNDQEARYVSRQPDLASAVAWLRQRVPLLALKRGADGAAVYQGDTVWERLVEPAQGGDSIGAGDCFDAGLLAGWLRGYDLDRCLEIACRCGTAVASAVGGIRGQPTWADVI